MKGGVGCFGARGERVMQQPALARWERRRAPPDARRGRRHLGPDPHRRRLHRAGGPHHRPRLLGGPRRADHGVRQYPGRGPNIGAGQHPLPQPWPASPARPTGRRDALSDPGEGPPRRVPEAADRAPLDPANHRQVPLAPSSACTPRGWSIPPRTWAVVPESRIGSPVLSGDLRPDETFQAPDPDPRVPRVVCSHFALQSEPFEVL